MESMLLSLWTRFRTWVTVDWSATTFYIVLSVLGVCVLMLLLGFLKGNYNKGKPIKWGNVVLLVILAALIGFLSYVRFA